MRLAAIAFVALVAALVLGWPVLVPVALALVGGAYGVELAIDDAPLDLAAPAVTVGLLLAAELAYWSLDERGHSTADRGLSLQRAAFVAVVAFGAFVIASALLALVGEVEAGGVAVDILGAVAAVAVILSVLALRRDRRRSSA